MYLNPHVTLLFFKFFLVLSTHLEEGRVALIGGPCFAINMNPSVTTPKSKIIHKGFQNYPNTILNIRLNKDFLNIQSHVLIWITLSNKMFLPD